MSWLEFGAGQSSKLAGVPSWQEFQAGRSSELAAGLKIMDPPLDVNYKQNLFGVLLGFVAKHNPEFKVPSSYRDDCAVQFWLLFYTFAQDMLQNICPDGKLRLVHGSAAVFQDD